MRKTGSLMNYQVVSMKYIKIQWNCMAYTLIVLLHIWVWQQCVLVSHNITGYHTINVHTSIVRNSEVYTYLVWRKINMKQTCVQQYIFMSTEIYYVVLCMVNSHNNNAHYVLCLPLMIFMWILVKYTHVESLCYLRPIYQNFTRITILQIHISWPVPRLASAVTLARAHTRGAGPSRTVQQHSNFPDIALG